MEVRFLGVRWCSHCNQAIMLLQPCGAAADSSDEARVLGVRIESAIATLLEKGLSDDVPSLVQSVIDLWHERSEVPARFALEILGPRDVLMGTVYLQGPSGLRAVRCSPGEGVLMAEMLGLPCVLGEGFVEGASRAYQWIHSRGPASSLH